MSEIAAFVDNVRRHYDDGCFACGRDNPIGLHLDDFGLNGNEVSATFTPRPEYRGSAGVLHGGITATALDEILVWAGILTERVMTVTGTLEFRYRRPVPLDRPLRIDAHVEKRTGKRLRISGALSDEERELVSASGLYVVTADIDDLLAGRHH